MIVEIKWRELQTIFRALSELEDNTASWDSDKYSCRNLIEKLRLISCACGDRGETE